MLHKQEIIQGCKKSSSHMKIETKIVIKQISGLLQRNAVCKEKAWCWRQHWADAWGEKNERGLRRLNRSWGAINHCLVTAGDSVSVGSARMNDLLWRSSSGISWTLWLCITLLEGLQSTWQASWLTSGRENRKDSLWKAFVTSLFTQKWVARRQGYVCDGGAGVRQL